MLAALLAHAALAAPMLEIQVGPGVSEVMVTCGDQVERVPVTGGVARLTRAPIGTCKVAWVRDVGTVDGPGEWICDDRGCERKAAEHRPVSDAAGRVNVIVPTPSHPWGELVCAGGLRARSDFVELVATFEGVPRGDDCTFYFKGGPPAKFRPVTPGTWSCQIIGATADCSLVRP